MPQPPRQRLALRIVLIFLAAALSLSAITGAILAANPHIGGYYLTDRRPYAPGTTPTARRTGLVSFARGPDGRIGIAPYGATEAPHDATILGSARFELQQQFKGFPRPVRVDWHLRTTDITRRNGPPGDDTKAWNAIAAQAIGSGVGNVRMPRAIRSGDAAATSIHPINFAYNAGYRLLHAPHILAASVLTAALLAAYLCRHQIRTRRRCAHNQCPACAYDRRGLPPLALCPECGAVPTSTGGAEGV